MLVSIGSFICCITELGFSKDIGTKEVMPWLLLCCSLHATVLCCLAIVCLSGGVVSLGARQTEVHIKVFAPPHFLHRQPSVYLNRHRPAFVITRFPQQTLDVQWFGRWTHSETCLHNISIVIEAYLKGSIDCCFHTCCVTDPWHYQCLPCMTCLLCWFATTYLFRISFQAAVVCDECMTWSIIIWDICDLYDICVTSVCRWWQMLMTRGCATLS